MLLYDPFCFAFVTGIGIQAGLTGIATNLLAVYLFGSNNIQRSLIFIDIGQILISIWSISAIHVKGFWGIYAVLMTWYSMSYFVYIYCRSRNLMTNFFKQIYAVMCLILTVALIIFFLSLTGTYDTVTGTSIMIGLVAIPFLIFIIFYSKIIKTIKSNPIYATNYQQKNLLNIFKLTMYIIAACGLLCAVFVLSGAFFGFPIFVNFGLVFLPVIALVQTVSNFFILINKSLDNNCSSIGTDIPI